MLFHNYHTHTCYCDGSDLPDLYVKQAIALGLGSLGFSSHAPVPFLNNFAIQPKKLISYINEIQLLKSVYHKTIPIYLSLEMDYIPDISTDFCIFKDVCNLDYTIGSVHLVKRKGREGLWFIDGPNVTTYDKGLQQLFDGDIQLAVETYYHQIAEMVRSQRPDIIGHFDKIKMHNRNRYFQEDEPWYRKAVSKTLDIIKVAGTIVEVNTRGLYKKRTDSLFPSVEILHEIFDKRIPITLNSDAHLPSELNLYYKEALNEIRSIGFKSIKIFSHHTWIDQNI
ncbi:MAG: histidinol-phosphatase [Bacteroidota bacterium]